MYEKIQQKGGHKNILKMISFKRKAQIVKDDSPPLKIAYIEFEWANYGNLKDFLNASGPLEKEKAHYYFIQLIDAIYFLHSIEISHRNIMPENLLLNEDFCLKVSDFKLSTEDAFDTKFKKGSLEYLPVEFHLYPTGTQIANKPIDVYEVGITFFNMFVGRRPWRSSNENDTFFIDYLCDKNNFWQKIRINHSDNLINEFKAIFEKMTYSVKNRITTEEIVSSKLYKIPPLNVDKLHYEMLRKFIQRKRISRIGTLSGNVKPIVKTKTFSLLNIGTKIAFGISYFIIGKTF